MALPISLASFLAILSLLTIGAAFTSPQLLRNRSPGSRASSRQPLTRHHVITELNVPPFIRNVTRPIWRPIRRLGRFIFLVCNQQTPRRRITKLQQDEESLEKVLSSAMQGLVLDKDKEMDELRLYLSMELGSLNTLMLFESFVEHALLNSGYQHGFTMDACRKKDTAGRIEALWRIALERPIDQKIDWRLRLLLDAHDKYCKDDRSFVDFYVDLWREISKPEHKIENTGEPVYITTKQEDFSGALVSQRASQSVVCPSGPSTATAATGSGRARGSRARGRWA
mmetsp:Transcript_18523/g.52900  ORF Transcript_18523/g.52900 Transcript_18523/m.52900 type:complete len:283 (+) Transcript_18523:1465-2313(+)